MIKSAENGVNIEPLDTLTYFTIDVIGDVGFGYKFRSLESKGSKIAEGIKKCVDVTADLKNRLLEKLFPFINYIPSAHREARKLELNASVEAVERVSYMQFSVFGIVFIIEYRISI